MSTTLSSLAAHGAAGGAGPVGWSGRLRQAWQSWGERRREARNLRKSLREIERLDDRSLVDIGLSVDEIQRVRSRDVFVPRAWAVPAARRSELLF